MTRSQTEKIKMTEIESRKTEKAGSKTPGF